MSSNFLALDVEQLRRTLVARGHDEAEARSNGAGETPVLYTRPSPGGRWVAAGTTMPDRGTDVCAQAVAPAADDPTRRVIQDPSALTAAKMPHRRELKRPRASSE